MLVGEECIKQEQACANDDGGVGNIEVWPAVTDDVDLNEVDDGAVGDAVMHVAECAAEDERERDRGAVDVVAETDHDDEDDKCRGEREDDETPADGVWGRGVGKEREGSSLVGPMRDEEEMRDDGNGVADGDLER